VDAAVHNLPVKHARSILDTALPRLNILLTALETKSGARPLGMNSHGVLSENKSADFFFLTFIRI
jgi:hypothetical protein